MREVIPLNHHWYYSAGFEPCQVTRDFEADKYTEVSIPHTNQMIPYQYFDEEMSANISCYKKQLTFKEAYKGKVISICFEGVAHVAEVYLNGIYIGEHRGGYTPFEIEITSYINWEGENQLTVAVDARERPDVPPFGNVVDYLTYGGIYREVYLKVVAESHIQDVFIHTQDVCSENKQIAVEVTTTKLQEGTLLCTLKNQEGTAITTWEQAISVPLTKTTHQIKDVALWSIAHPNLYTLEVTLQDQAGEPVDCVEERFGFREARFKTDGFYLNGEKVKIRGLNRHQSFAYTGYAMPKSLQEKDADILKYELGCNLVRTSHYPQSKHFIRRCDEIGLLVFTEIPGWQFVSDYKGWRQVVLQNVEEMIVRDRNHPSIVLWGVRINESQDDSSLYQQTNSLARTLDPTRQTGGVRNFAGSEILEDVYTYNDFVHQGTNQALDVPDKISRSITIPYLVSEHNGHMFPTKRFDHEKKRLEHALRHMRVLESMYASPRISGAIGWCMNDYHTHKDFGSGDKICYHGVMDMFRVPKLAAAVYASQQDETDVLVISSEMAIGEHAGGQVGPVYAFTNCDYVGVYKNETFLGNFYPDTNAFSHVPHPPILIDDFIGDQLDTVEGYSPRHAALIKASLLDVTRHGTTLPFLKKLKLGYALLRTGSTMEKGVALYGKYIANWGGNVVTYRFEGYKNGQCVQTVTKGAVSKPMLRVTADTTTLIEADTYDATRVVVEAIDEYGNGLPFASQVIQVTVEGPVEILGPSVLALIGGVQGIYIRTKGEAGQAVVKVKSEQLGEQQVELTIKVQAV